MAVLEGSNAFLIAMKKCFPGRALVLVHADDKKRVVKATLKVIAANQQFVIKHI